MSRRVTEFTEAGFSLEDCKHIMCRQPSVFNLLFQQTVLPKLLLLLRGLRTPAAGDPLTEEEIRRLVVSHPCILSRSPANIERKLKYLVIELQRESREILVCTRYLGVSLESRIVPRATYMRALGVDQRMYALNTIFVSTDAAFCKTLSTDVEDYIAFKQTMHGN